jgi:folate-binding protein YgfZ
MPATEGYDAARTGAALFDLSPRGKIEAAGADAAVFLHNLCTNDIKSLPPGHGCETFFCTATAKVVAYGRVWRRPPEGKHDTLWLDLDPGLGAKAYQHLDRYLISEDVALTDQTEALAQLHLAGPKAAEVLDAAGVDPGPWQRLTFRAAGPALTIRHVDPLGLPGIDLVCPAGDAAALAEKLVAAGARRAGPEEFEVLRVEAGTPVWGADLDESTFAPEVGRTAQAISYQKGCYLGQEPIVMARDRGVVQRSLVGLLLGDEPAPPGALLYRDGKEVGRVTSSVRSPRLGAVALAYVRRGSQAPGTELELEIVGARRAVKVAALPFGQ